MRSALSLPFQAGADFRQALTFIGPVATPAVADPEKAGSQIITVNRNGSTSLTESEDRYIHVAFPGQLGASRP